MPIVSQTRLSLSGREVQNQKEAIKKMAESGSISLDSADALGFSFASPKVAYDLAHGMDAAPALNSTASIPVPVQFLQNFLPGYVANAPAARLIDEIVGINTVGSWEEEEIVQEFLENVGVAVPYGDLTNTPFTNWNLNFNKRTVVRFESDVRVGVLEEARVARVRIDSATSKRKSSMMSLDIQRNLVGFNGYNGGNNLTYGFLTDPFLPSYVTVAAGAESGSPTQWSKKTYNEIQSDILTSIVQLRTQSQEVVNPSKDKLTLAVPTNAEGYLHNSTQYGITVYKWLAENFPNIRVVSAPQLNTANGGVGVFYLFADAVDDGLSTDDGKTFIQVVPAKFMALGVERTTKGFEEAYAMATAGTMCKRPFAVCRYSGIS